MENIFPSSFHRLLFFIHSLLHIAFIYALNNHHRNAKFAKESNGMDAEAFSYLFIDYATENRFEAISK